LDDLVLLRRLALSCVLAGHMGHNAGDSERAATACDELQHNCWDAHARPVEPVSRRGGCRSPLVWDRQWDNRRNRGPNTCDP
jgi:hypothetical protein